MDIQIELDKFSNFLMDYTIKKSTKNYIVGHFFDHPDRAGFLSSSIRIAIRWIEIQLYPEGPLQSG